MSQILSQDEVDALLKGVSDGAIPAGEGGAAPRGVQTLDLTNQERSLRGRSPGLELIVERFVKGLRVSLGSFLGQLPNVTSGELELIKFGTFISRLAQPMSLQLFRMPPLRGHGMVVATPSLASAVLQAIFGGNPNRRTPIPGREFSSIEQRVLERLATSVLKSFQEAWRPVASIEFAFARSEANPRFAKIAPPQDLVMLLEMKIAIEGEENAALSLCIPKAALDPVREQLQAGPGEEREAPPVSWADRWRELVAAAPLEVAAELGTCKLALRQVLALKTGDVLTLGTGRDGPVRVRIEGRPRFVAMPGVSGDHNAVRVTGRL